MKITFYGAAQEVTGSKYLIEDGDTKILVDCGLFQGDEEFSSRNWDVFPVEPANIEAIVLTHAHIDHTGYVPLLVRNGFKGKIYCSKATYALCNILLRDCGLLFENESRRTSASPLYTLIDAENALKLFHIVPDEVFSIGKSLKINFIFAGHIPGAKCVVVSNGKQTVTFSGDLGRPDALIMKAPAYIKQTDFLVLESTYGDRLHEKIDPVESLSEIVNDTVKKGGRLIIPAFAVGRSQDILYCLYQLRQKKLIPNIPIFLDSPTAIEVSRIFCSFADEYQISADVCEQMLRVARFTQTVEESKRIDYGKRSSIIIAASGMANGGRVLHHFKHFISGAKNTILFTSFQAEGTNGRILVDGAKEIKIHDALFKVRAEIKMLNIFSAHADYSETLAWLGHLENSPKKIFITHGQLESAQSLKNKIEERFGWSVIVPKYCESFDLE